MRDQLQAQGNTRAQPWPGSSWGFHSADVTSHRTRRGGLYPCACTMLLVVNGDSDKVPSAWRHCLQMRKSDNGGWFRRNVAVVISAHVVSPVSLVRRESRPAQPAPTRCLRRQNVLCHCCFERKTEPWPSAEETVALHRITPNQRKARCSVLEIMS